MSADALSKVFAALADPTRRDMVARLASGDATVTKLAEPYDVTLQAVSLHLKVLEGAGLVSRSREAQRRTVHLEAARQTHQETRRATQEKTTKMTTTKEGDRRGRPRCADGADHPRFRRPGRQSIPGPRRPGLVRQVERPEQPDIHDRAVRFPHRWRVPLHNATRRVRSRLPRTVPRHPHQRTDRANVHLRRDARQCRVGETPLRRHRQRSHPPHRHLARRQFRRPRRLIARGMETSIQEGYERLDTLFTTD